VGSPVALRFDDDLALDGDVRAPVRIGPARSEAAVKMQAALPINAALRH
jgi:hypothetical protein